MLSKMIIQHLKTDNVKMDYLIKIYNNSTNLKQKCAEIILRDKQVLKTLFNGELK